MKLSLTSELAKYMSCKTSSIKAYCSYVFVIIANAYRTDPAAF